MAVRGLRSSGGSRIADGIQAAADELQHTAIVDGNNAVMLVFTDGDAKGRENEVIAAADSAKAQHIRLISVGVSKQPVETLLRTIASAESDYYLAAEPEHMPELYASLIAMPICQ